MTNWYSWNFLVPKCSFLQYSVWKFSVPEFCFTENTWIHFIFKFQWLGDDRLRRILEGKLLLLRLVCETVSGVFQDATHPLAAVSDGGGHAGSTRRRQISQPCLALRIAGSPGKTTQHIHLTLQHLLFHCNHLDIKFSALKYLEVKNRRSRDDDQEKGELQPSINRASHRKRSMAYR